MYLRISLNYHISIKRNYIKQSLHSLICTFTFATVALCISRITSPVTMSSPFVTRRVFQTVPTTVVDSPNHRSRRNTLLALLLYYKYYTSNKRRIFVELFFFFHLAKIHPECRNILAEKKTALFNI